MAPPRQPIPPPPSEADLRSRKAMVRLVLWSLAALLVLTGGYFTYDYLVLGNPKFTVTKVTLQGLTRSDEGDFRRRHKLDKLNKANLFAIDLRTIQKSIAADPMLRKVSVRRILPGTLSISVEERIPVARLLSPGGCAIDSAGNVLPPLTDPRYDALPLIVGHKSLIGIKPKDEAADEVKAVVELAKFIAATAELAELLDVQRYQIDEQSYVPSVVMIVRERFPLRDNARIRVPLAKEGKNGFVEKLMVSPLSLKVIVNDRLLRGEFIESVDLTLNDNVPVSPRPRNSLSPVRTILTPPDAPAPTPRSAR